MLKIKTCRNCNHRQPSYKVRVCRECRGRRFDVREETQAEAQEREAATDRMNELINRLTEKD